MVTQIVVRKLNREVAELKGDVREMKRFLFSPLKDAEGEYKESYIRKILGRSQSKKPLYKFSGKSSFLAHVRSKK